MVPAPSLSNQVSGTDRLGRAVGQNKAAAEIKQHTQLSEGALLCIIQLCPLDDDGVGRQVDPPGQGGRAAQHLQQALPKQPLHQVAV